MKDVEPSVVLARPLAHVAVVTINRPSARNAVNGDVTRAMRTIVDETEDDPDTWVVLLTGAGGQAFSAGADLKEVGAGRIQSLMDEQNGFAGFVHAKRRKLWIAAVEGYALAGGFEMVLACDLVIASTGSSFGLPEVTRGLVASAGGLYRAPRALPRNVAIELVATGRTMTAARAYEVGLLNSVVPPGEALPAALALADEICRNAPLAVRESIGVARLAADLTDVELRRRSEAAQMRIVQTYDFQEGPRAFMEKRAPVWEGR